MTEKEANRIVRKLKYGSQDLTKVIPTPANYDEYVRQREVRTEKALAQSVITGQEVREKNLSVTMIMAAGFRHDPVTDNLVKD